MAERPALQGRLVIVYHGTDENSARQIRTKGFRPGTYFARHLEDAMGFGGEHVFEVAFPARTAEELGRVRRGWQFVAPWVVPRAWIVAENLYRKEPISKNDRLRKLVFSTNR